MTALIARFAAFLRYLRTVSLLTHPNSPFCATTNGDPLGIEEYTQGFIQNFSVGGGGGGGNMCIPLGGCGGMLPQESLEIYML